MILALVLMFAIGWSAASGAWGLVVIFSLLELVEMYRRGKRLIALEEETGVKFRSLGI